MAKDVARVRNVNISSIRLYFIVLDSLGMELMFLYTKGILSMILLKCHKGDFGSHNLKSRESYFCMMPLQVSYYKL